MGFPSHCLPVRCLLRAISALASRRLRISCGLSSTVGGEHHRPSGRRERSAGIGKQQRHATDNADQRLAAGDVREPWPACGRLVGWLAAWRSTRTTGNAEPTRQPAACAACRRCGLAATRRDASICNVIKCRLPDNRRPTPEEVAACRPFLLEQIALVDAPLILLAGATALEGVLGIRGGITKLRGQWRQGEGEGLASRWLMPIVHPSYLLRNASREQGSPKWLTWQDLKEVRRRLEGLL